MTGHGYEARPRPARSGRNRQADALQSNQFAVSVAYFAAWIGKGELNFPEANGEELDALAPKGSRPGFAIRFLTQLDLKILEDHGSYRWSGDSLNGFTDPLRRRKSIDWIHMRYEEAAAFAAGAEAHLTGSLAVCAGSCGPGNLHLRGKEFVEYDNPYDVGMTGLVGFASGYAAMKNCDALLLLGTDFPYRAFCPEQAKIAQVDVRPEALGNRCSLHLGLLGNVKDTLDAVLPSIKEKTDSSHLNEALIHYTTARRDLDALAESGPNSNIIHPQYVTRLVSELAADDAIFTCDVRTPIIWTARYLKVNGRRRIIGSFNHGSMANAMLQAIGAQATYPNRQVISMSGDGGFSMMMGDFITLSQMGLPVKVIVLNNGTLGFVEMEMKASGFLDTGCDLKNPNFALMAEAMGIRGIRVEKPQELKGAIEAVLAHKGPVLLVVLSARQELAIPPKTTLDQAYHFGMFMMKAVLDGRATQLVDLAKVNLSR